VIRTALVTGGNRGIGLAVCRLLARRGLHVVLASRDGAAGEKAAAALGAAAGVVRAEALDVASDASVEALAERLRAERIRIDVLVNNAGIYPSAALLDAGGDEVLDEALEVNFLGAVRTCRAFVPAMVRAGYGRVVNVSSGYGSFGEGLEGPAPYSISKAALNALTVTLAQEVARAPDVKVNAVCPGWVRTRMGGRGAPVSPEDAAESIVRLATLAADGPSGRFFRGEREIPW
jgi:NAD(P)-dependent dehydrogenase (short-subunit alcohol dehydrogenase family)